MSELVDLVIKVRVETGADDAPVYDAEETMRYILDRPQPRTTTAEIRSFEFILANVVEEAE